MSFITEYYGFIELVAEDGNKIPDNVIEEFKKCLEKSIL